MVAKKYQNPSGGLNEAGRKYYNSQGMNLKRPQPEGGSRKKSFCARMRGMRKRQKANQKLGLARGSKIFLTSTFV